MNRPTAYRLWLLPIVLALPIGCTPPADEIAKESAGEADSEVTLQILDYDGLQELIASHQGSVVVLDVWSTTCLPCLREFPGLVKLDRQYDEVDVACISVSLDYLGASNREPEYYRDDVLNVLKRFDATFENVLAAEGTDTMYEKLGVITPPAVLVYDRQGELVRRFVNQNNEEFTYDDVGELVAQMVEQGGD